MKERTETPVINLMLDLLATMGEKLQFSLFPVFAFPPSLVHFLYVYITFLK